jgi:4-amino-4-deoxy-L-arabinose transferase-like glycosyltransferase
VSTPARKALHAVFRPRRARVVAIWVASVQAVVLLAVALALPGYGPEAYHWYDRLVVVLISAGVGWLLWRFATVRLQPREDGLVVRNLLLSRDLVWAQVVAVRFGGGGPWVMLDLDDGETLAAMAIQRADGPRGEQEAQRLATLVALHSRTARDD